MNLLKINALYLNRQRSLIKNCHFSIEAGQCWAVLGPNGAGKTSLFYALLNWLPYSGKIQWFGRDLKQYSRLELARQIGLLPQHLNPSFDLTIADYLNAHAYPWGGIAQDRLYDCIQSYELGDLNRPLHQLSGGEMQKVALAGLIVQNPRFALIDEPNNQLDPKQQVHLLNLIRDFFHSGRAAMIILHDLNLALRFCSHLLLLRGNGQWRIVLKEQADTQLFSWLYEAKIKRSTGFYFD